MWATVALALQPQAAGFVLARPTAGGRAPANPRLAAPTMLEGPAWQGRNMPPSYYGPDYGPPMAMPGDGLGRGYGEPLPLRRAAGPGPDGWASNGVPPLLRSPAGMRRTAGRGNRGDGRYGPTSIPRGMGMSEDGWTANGLPPLMAPTDPRLQFGEPADRARSDYQSPTNLPAGYGMGGGSSFTDNPFRAGGGGENPYAAGFPYTRQAAAPPRQQPTQAQQLAAQRTLERKPTHSYPSDREGRPSRDGSVARATGRDSIPRAQGRYSYPEDREGPGARAQGPPGPAGVAARARAPPNVRRADQVQFDLSSLYSVGEETPMKGREKEYKEFKETYGDQAGMDMGMGGEGGGAPPPIDDERRNRSPGLQNNFYDVSTADFKRPHGMPRGAPMPPPMEEGMRQGMEGGNMGGTMGGGGGGGGNMGGPMPGGGPMGGVPMGAPPPRMRRQIDPSALYQVGEEMPMPGREKEYKEFISQSVGADASTGPVRPPPPVDAERLSRSPGLQNNFFDVSTADFKRPHGMPPGTPVGMPPQPEMMPPPPAAVATPAPAAKPPSKAPPAPEPKPAPEATAAKPAPKAAKAKAAATPKAKAKPAPAAEPPKAKAAPAKAKEVQGTVSPTRVAAPPLGDLPDLLSKAESVSGGEADTGSGGAAIEQMRAAKAALLEASGAFAASLDALDGKPPAKGSERSQPPLGDLSALMARATALEADTIRQGAKERANTLFQERMSALDVTSDAPPDFEAIRADCLALAEQEAAKSGGGAAVEQMRAARAAVLEASKAFAASVASLDGKPPPAKKAKKAAKKPAAKKK